MKGFGFGQTHPSSPPMSPTTPAVAVMWSGPDRDALWLISPVSKPIIDILNWGSVPGIPKKGLKGKWLEFMLL